MNKYQLLMIASVFFCVLVAMGFMSTKDRPFHIALLQAVIITAACFGGLKLPSVLIEDRSPMASIEPIVIGVKEVAPGEYVPQIEAPKTKPVGSANAHTFSM